MLTGPESKTKHICGTQHWDLHDALRGKFSQINGLMLKDRLAYVPRERSLDEIDSPQSVTKKRHQILHGYVTTFWHTNKVQM